jgi:hypothetical protein
MVKRYGAMVINMAVKFTEKEKQEMLEFLNKMKPKKENVFIQKMYRYPSFLKKIIKIVALFQQKEKITLFDFDSILPLRQNHQFLNEMAKWGLIKKIKVKKFPEYMDKEVCVLFEKFKDSLGEKDTDEWLRTYNHLESKYSFDLTDDELKMLGFFDREKMDKLLEKYRGI